MIKVSRKEVLNDYKFIKKTAFKLSEKKCYEDAIKAIEFACTSAYMFNERYVDNEIEELCSNLSTLLLKPKEAEFKLQNRYVFYDCFGIDNRGLSQQYIRALNSLKVPFLFILNSDNISLSVKILDELKSMEYATVCIVPTDMSRVSRIDFIDETINEYGATKAFLHMAPWDVVGAVVWNAQKSIVKFQINLTDHAFWLGKKCSDFCIEFRDYGHNVSLKHRGFGKQQLLFLPFYPILDDTEDFQEFKFDLAGKVVMFTGGNFYKMYGEKGKFFSLIKSILNNNENVVLLIAGGGNSDPLDKFILENRFQNRVYNIGNRKDLNSVFTKVDIYLSTFPLGGGLMTQLAAAHKKNIVAYTTEDLTCNNLEDLVKVDYKITFNDEINFLGEIRKLVSDEEYRIRKAKGISLIITEDQFNSSVFKLINLTSPISYTPKIFDIDTARFAQLYLETENDYLKKYDNFIFSFTRFAKLKVPLRMVIRSAIFAVKKVFN